MIIETNKHYINALGDVIFIRKYELNITYCFIDNDNRRYTYEGLYCLRDKWIYDLICECIPDILNKYMDKDITQKEFIQQHIDYYTKGIR